MSPQEQAEYLTHFRADSIVRDAELIRRELGVERWSVLGQSFGGFCVVTYLSQAPDGLAEAFITGGLPPLDRHPDDVYRATYGRMLDRNRRYYERYPQDRGRVLAILERLENEDVRLPSGDRLTTRRFRQLGHMLGMSDGNEKLHYIVELPFGSPAFLHDVEAAHPSPGTRSTPSSTRPVTRTAPRPAGLPSASTRQEFRDDPTLLTGEHIFSWMLEDYGALSPLAEAAQILAEHEWPALYDPQRLAENDVPAAAAIYAEDPYVEREFSEQTAAAIRGLRPWVTNEYDHDALRADGERVLGRLLDLVQGRA